MDGRHPCSADQALKRMQAMVGAPYPYVLGTGDYNKPSADAPFDVPWTWGELTHGQRPLVLGSDCAGAALCYAFGLLRHRLGYNNGPWASVADDINCNSAIEDAQHAQELFKLVPAGELIRSGDLLTYPTISLRTPDGKDWLRNDDGSIRKWIGHVQMVEFANGAVVTGSHYAGIDVIHCHGGNGRKPAITRDKATAMDLHNQNWPKPEHCVKVLRVNAAAVR